MSDNKIVIFNRLQIEHLSCPSVSPCGNYVAYVTSSEQQERKLVVRQLSSRPYTAIYQRYLSRIFAEHLAPYELDTNGNVSKFLKQHLIKGTSKTLLSEKTVPSAAKDSSEGIELEWMDSGDVPCERVCVLDKQLDALCVLSISDEHYKVVVQSDGKSLGMDRISFLQGLEGEQFLGIWYQNAILGRILCLSNLSIVYEIGSPKETAFYKRDLDTYSVMTRSSGASYLENFKCSPGEVLPLGRFKLLRDIKQLQWSPTGKWCGYLDAGYRINLSNIFGMGKSLKSEYFSPISEYDLSPDLSIYDAFIRWGLFSIQKLDIENRDTNYPLLEKVGEALLVADNNDRIHIFSTHLGLQLASVIDHKLLTEGENTAYWVQKQQDFERIMIDSVLPVSDNCQGIDILRIELTEKYKTLSSVKNSVFANEYICQLTQKLNLLATKLKASPKSVYVWDLSAVFEKKSGLFGILETENTVVDLSWHPILPGILLIVTTHDLIVFSAFSKPIVIVPRFALETGRETIKSASWVKEPYANKLKMVCTSSNDEFVVIDTLLTDLQTQPFKNLIKDTGLRASNEGESIWLFEENAERDDSDISLSVLMDDDTNANRMMNDVKQKEWVRTRKTSEIPGMEDTFSFKRKKT